MSDQDLQAGRRVATYQYPGCTIYVSDAAYRGKSAAELEEIREAARRIARTIFLKELRNREVT